MFMLSGCQERKSARRQPGDRRLTGLGFAECTRSGNCAPSRTKNTCREDSATVAPWCSSHYLCSCLIACGQGAAALPAPTVAILWDQHHHLTRILSADGCGAGQHGQALTGKLLPTRSQMHPCLGPPWGDPV